MTSFHPILTACAVLALSTAAAGCSRLSARSVPAPPPPLDVPSPPPRVVETADAEPPTPGTLVDAPASGSPSTRRPPPRVEAPRPEQPPKPEPVAPAAAEVPPAEPPKPVTTLQTTPPEREAALEQEIRAKLESAKLDLNRVDYRKLNPEAKQQYDQAKSFATRAEEAIRGPAKNLIFARTLADNAAAIAAQLASR
jgi:hypothetical protein